VTGVLLWSQRSSTTHPNPNPATQTPTTRPPPPPEGQSRTPPKICKGRQFSPSSPSSFRKVFAGLASGGRPFFKIHEGGGIIEPFGNSTGGTGKVLSFACRITRQTITNYSVVDGPVADGANLQGEVRSKVRVTVLEDSLPSSERGQKKSSPKRGPEKERADLEERGTLKEGTMCGACTRVQRRARELMEIRLQT